MNIKKYLIPFGLLIVGLLMILLLINRSQPQPKQINKVMKGSPLPVEKTVSLSDKGFTPSTITVKVNEAVRWRNDSRGEASVNSDNHPTNRLYPELNLGMFSKGQSLVHIFTKPGTYTYHNYKNPENKGTVIVEK